MNRLEDAVQAATATAENAVTPARQINAGSGLTGGGDLSQDRTLSLADTAIAAGSYINANITVDQKGRLTAAGNGSSSGGGGGSVSVENQGSVLTTRSVINFVGEGISASDDSTNARTQVQARVTPARGSLPSNPQTNQLGVDTSVVSTGQEKQWDGSAWQLTQPADPTAGVPGLRTLGTGAQQACAGNDSRIARSFYLPITFFYSGAVSAKTGVGHDPIVASGTLDAFWVVCDSAPAGGAVTVTFVKEAAGPGGTATTIGSIILAIGYKTATPITNVGLSVAQGDTVRMDVTTGSGYTAGSCQNLTGKGRYSY